jgi:hypothetical protein
VQATDQVRASRIGETRELAAKDNLRESVVEEDILHIELLNEPVTGDSSGEHRANGGRFHNRAESLIVVDSGALSETLKDLASLVAIKCPVSVELVREDPLAGDNVGALRPGNKLPGPIAHQGPYSSSIATRQLGSASAARVEVGIRDGVSEEVVTVRTRRSGTTLKPVLPRVIIRCGFFRVGHDASVLPSEAVGAVVWPEELLRPPPPLLFLPLLPPPLPLLRFLLLFLFRLPPLPPLGGRDGVEDGGLVAGGVALG